jgi:hypothetical protein
VAVRPGRLAWSQRLPIGPKPSVGQLGRRIEASLLLRGRLVARGFVHDHDGSRQVIADVLQSMSQRLGEIADCARDARSGDAWRWGQRPIPLREIAWRPGCAPILTENLSPSLRAHQVDVQNGGFVSVEPGRRSWWNLQVQNPRRTVLEDLTMMRLVVDGNDRLLARKASDRAEEPEYSCNTERPTSHDRPPHPPQG